MNIMWYLVLLIIGSSAGVGAVVVSGSGRRILTGALGLTFLICMGVPLWLV